MKKNNTLANVIMAVITSLLSVSTSFSLVGLNETANAHMYGEPIGEGPAEPLGKYYKVYQRDGFLRVMEIYGEDGFSIGQTYFKSNNSSITDEDIEKVLEHNTLNPKYQWKQVKSMPAVFVYIHKDSPYTNKTLEQFDSFSAQESGDLVAHPQTAMLAGSRPNKNTITFTITKLKK